MRPTPPTSLAAFVLCAAALAAATSAGAAANATCRKAVSCLAGGATVAAFNDMCSFTCAQKGNAATQLVEALTKKDKLAACSASVGLAVQLTSAAVEGFLEAGIKEVMGSILCADNRGLCRNDAACHQQMAQACNAQTVGDKIAEKLCAMTSYARDAGKPLQCGDGLVNKGGLCYPPCPKEYDGHDDQLFCYAKCPSGYKDFGLTCTNSKLQTVSKKKHARPVGKAISSCPSSKEKDGALCYDRCMAGFNGVANRCWKK